jgi:hypothetical protein
MSTHFATVVGQNHKWTVQPLISKPQQFLRSEWIILPKLPKGNTQNNFIKIKPQNIQIIRKGWLIDRKKII